jgi:alginate O-acetyltransferase complex protein AlgI
MFTIQIYADFAGYSNMAIGVGKLLGFNIMRNFAYPYFARDIREFWQRWNISLTTWFRDYVFLPIAYSVSGIIKSDRLFFIKTEYLIYTVGITVTWMLTGLWHGANYTFIIWGLIQGLFLLIHHVAAKPRRRLLKRLHVRNDSAPLAILDYFATFVVVMFSWIFFRADNVEHAWAYVSGIFSPSILRLPLFAGRVGALITLILVFAFLSIEWLGRKHEYGIAGLGLRWPKPARWAMYYAFILAIFYFSGKDQQFIYFQF